MEWEENVDFYESDEDHNPVLVKRMRKLEPSEDDTEKHLHEVYLISSQILKSEPEDYLSEGEICRDEVEQELSSTCQSNGFEGIKVFEPPEEPLESSKINDLVNSSSQIFKSESDGYLSEGEIIIEEIEDDPLQATVFEQGTGSVAEESEKDPEIDIGPGKDSIDKDPVEVEVRGNDTSLYSSEENDGRKSVSKTGNDHEANTMITGTTEELLHPGIGDSVTSLKRDNPVYLITSEGNLAGNDDAIIELENIIQYSFTNLQELNLILSSGSDIVLYDGENTVQTPLSWLEKVLKITKNIQSLSVSVENSPENLKLPELPYLTQLTLDSLVEETKVDFSPFQCYFPQLLELKIEDFEGWKNEYNQPGHFPNLRTLILAGISGIKPHWQKVLKIFHTLNAPLLKVLELCLNHQRNGEKPVHVESAIRIGTTALNKRNKVKWEGTPTEVESCGCRKLRFSTISESEAPELQTEVDNCHQKRTLEREDFRNSLEVETCENGVTSEIEEDDGMALVSTVNGMGNDDTAKETIIELEITIEYEEDEDHPNRSLRFSIIPEPEGVNEINALESPEEVHNVHQPSVLEREEDLTNTLEVETPGNEVGSSESEENEGIDKSPVDVEAQENKSANSSEGNNGRDLVEDAGNAHVVTNDVAEDNNCKEVSTLNQIGKVLRIDVPDQDSNGFYKCEKELMERLKGFVKTLELNQTRLFVHWNPPSENSTPILPLPSLPQLTSLTLKTTAGMADYAPFEPYFPQLLQLQIGFNCWKDEYNQPGLFPNLRTLILGGINISENLTHWIKVLQIFETLKAPSLTILELRLRKKPAKTQVEKCLQLGTWALNSRVNGRGKWEGTRTYLVGRGGYRSLRFSIKPE